MISAHALPTKHEESPRRQVDRLHEHTTLDYFQGTLVLGWCAPVRRRVLAHDAMRASLPLNWCSHTQRLASHKTSTQSAKPNAQEQTRHTDTPRFLFV